MIIDQADQGTCFWVNVPKQLLTPPTNWASMIVTQRNLFTFLIVACTLKVKSNISMVFKTK